jgi:hypothetical protein
MNLKSSALPAVMKAALVASLLCASACAKPLEAPQGQVLTINGIEVSVTDVKLVAIDLEGPAGAIATKKSTLIVALKLTNKSAEPLRYDLGWSTTSSTQATSPLLFLDPGPEIQLSGQAQIPALILGSSVYTPDPVASPRTLNPGEGVDDLLLFDAPPENAKALLLSLPPALFGKQAKSPAYIRIATVPTEVQQPQWLSEKDEHKGPSIHFKIKSVETSYPPLLKADGTRGTSAEPLVGIRFTATNAGTTALEYLPIAAGLAVDAPSLTDSSDAPIERVDFGPGVTHTETLTARKSLAPGASLDDVWWFARPANTVTELLLRAPGKRFGDTGLIRFKIPYTWSDPRQFAEIMPAPALGSTPNE